MRCISFCNKLIAFSTRFLISSSSNTSCFSEFDTDKRDVALSASLEGRSIFDSMPACSSFKLGEILINSVNELLRLLASASTCTSGLVIDSGILSTSAIKYVSPSSYFRIFTLSTPCTIADLLLSGISKVFNTNANVP